MRRQNPLFIYVPVVLMLAFTISVHSKTCLAKTALDEENDSDNSNFNIYVENDTKRLGGPGSDSSYTNGVRFSYVYADNREPGWAHLFPWMHHYFEGHEYNFGIGIGQQIYTPEDLTRSDVITNDRPYAGWLYLSPVLIVDKGEFLDTFEFDVGMVGGPSLAEPTQKGFHHLIGVAQPQGWDHQIGTELGGLISFQKKYKFFELLQNQDWRYLDTIPYWGWGLGNVYVGGDMGVLVRLGYNIPQDFGPVRPSSSNSDSFVQMAKPEALPEKRKNWSFYIFGGFKESLVLHDIFIDGSTFQDSQRVTRVPLQSEYEGGLALQFKKVGVIWRQVTRTAEFYETYKPHTFASITLSIGQKF